MVPMYTKGIYGFVPKKIRWRPNIPNGSGNARTAAMIFLLLFLVILMETKGDSNSQLFMENWTDTVSETKKVSHAMLVSVLFGLLFMDWAE